MNQYVLAVAESGADVYPDRYYRLLEDARAASSNYVRVVDDSNEDYLYPMACFLMEDGKLKVFTDPVCTAQLRVEVVFFSSGRRMMPDLKSGRYMPHLNVEDDGLGVAFVDGPEEVVFNRWFECTARLIHHPRVNYWALQAGSLFLVMEGKKTVGCGKVLGSKTS